MCRKMHEAAENPYQHWLPDFQKTAPLTQSLIGVLQRSKLDAQDYKRHMEDKYL